MIVGILLYMVIITVISSIAESRRKAVDRLMTALVATAFLIALLPLVSLLWTVVANGIERFDAEFFSYSMRNVVGDGGGIVHAIWGTVLITLTATIISVPIGLMTSIYLVEYGRGKIAKAITFFVDVMTGIRRSSPVYSSTPCSRCCCDRASRWASWARSPSPC